MNIYTRDGWQHNRDGLKEGDRCCECGEPATVLTRPDLRDDKVLWAQCENCVQEMEAEMTELQRRKWQDGEA